MPSIPVPGENLFLNLPLDWFEEHRLTFHGWNVFPEFLVSADMLDRLEEGELICLARTFRLHGKKCTVHAPFTGTNLGSGDGEVLASTRRRMRETLEISDVLRPEAIVVHTGYNPQQVGDRFDEWWDRARDSIQLLGFSARKYGLRLAFENVFDRTPDVLERIMTEFPALDIGVCLDAGHINMFSPQTSAFWIDTFGYRVFEVHLHDNNGQADEHNALGAGSIDFTSLFLALDSMGIEPCFTIENQSEADVETSLRYLHEKSWK